MKIPFINLKKQYLALQLEIQERINSVLDHGQYIMGPEVDMLEQKLAAYSGAKNCITVSSGTEALLISLMSLGVGPGDEVITTPFTFAATAEVIALLGALPVFVDIEFDTCNIDASHIEKSITGKTKAIIPVSLYGQPPDMDRINRIAAQNGDIPVIEDAAQSFGSEYRGKKSCNLSTIGCTSFFPSKPLGCYGDGGAIFTSNDEIANACRQIRIHGQSQRYLHTRIGVGGRMDTIQCAILLAKLERFEWEISRRIQIGACYNQKFDLAGIQHVKQKPFSTSVFAQYTIFSRNREFLVKELERFGIPTSIHYPVPLHLQPMLDYLGYKIGDYPVAEEISKKVLSLPMSPDLSEDEQNIIIDSVIKFNKLNHN